MFVQNYVTYREFLLYLEEYQRTKMPELKNRKAGAAKASSDNATGNSPANPPPPRVKMNSQGNNNVETTGPSGEEGHFLGPINRSTTKKNISFYISNFYLFNIYFILL